MNAWILIAILLFPSAVDARRSVEYCPELPAHSGLVWEYLEGGDFIGCIATRRSGGARVFGVYLGQHPSFIADPSRRRAKGTIGGTAAHWQLPGPGSEEGVVLEAQVHILATEADPPLQSVVWVYTSNRGNHDEAAEPLHACAFVTIGGGGLPDHSNRSLRRGLTPALSFAAAALRARARL